MPRSPEVDAWFEHYDNPMKPVVLRMRAIILGADRRIEECIKWQAPTFTFEGNLASFFPKSKQHASLMFHQGARIPGEHPRLSGGGGTGRIMKIGSVAEANAAKRELENVVRAWCAWKGGSAAVPVAERATPSAAKKKKPKAERATTVGSKTKTKTKAKSPRASRHP